MITIYTGTPGSGKSFHIAEVIYNCCRKRKPVVSNFNINRDYVKSKVKHDFPFFYLPNDELYPSKIINIALEYAKNNGGKLKESQLLLVIDEAQIILNSREWSGGVKRSEWVSFFSQHRKYGYDVVLIAQFDQMIDKQIRSLIEYQVIHRKVGNFGAAGKVISLFAAGNLFVGVKVWYPLKEKVGTDFFRVRSKIYKMYETFTFFEVQDAKEIEKKEKESAIDSAGLRADFAELVGPEPMESRQDPEHKENQAPVGA